MPTFQIYKDGKKVGEIVGADKNKLEAEIVKVSIRSAFEWSSK
jgi:hypothetical protein